ncbi:MAG: phosphate acetyltransferase [Deltaproteobacteria bacterium]|nr:phosphate acetyltransferase [Deltaproteobacteria bacterium]
MAKGVYIASIQPRAGKSLAALGLMELASRRVEHLQNAEASSGGPYDEARAMAGADRSDELLARILGRYKELESQCDFVVCEGTDYSGVGAAFEFEFNARVAAHLGCPVFFVANGQGREPAAVVEDVRAARRAFEREGCSIVATLVNRVAPRQIDQVKECFAAEWKGPDPVYVVPEDETLGHPTLAEVMDALDGKLMFGDEHRLQGLARDFSVAAMELPNVLSRLRPGSVVIAGGDRADVVLGCLASVRSQAFPNIAGIVLTGGLEPPEPVTRLINGLRRPAVPVIGVAGDTFTTATRVDALGGAIKAGDERKIATALGLFEEHVELPELAERIQVSHSPRVTPLRFEYELIERAKVSRQHIVLPEGTDERILRAAEILLRRRVVDLTLLGDPAEIQESASTLGVHLEGAQIVDPLTSEWRSSFADTYLQLRKHKGVTEDRAHDAMGDVSYFGSMMVYQGKADGMVSGAAHTTAHTIRPALEFIRTREGVSVVSSVFLMCLRDRVLVYGDCAVNPNPNSEQLADIAISSAETAVIFGIDPRIAMLSYSTGASGSGEDVARVREATEIVRSRRPDLMIDGPIQYDAAVDAKVASKKLPDSEVAGRATVFIFPDLNTGNNTYKAVQRSAGAVAIGPVLQGLNKPVNDLSRGCTVSDVVNTVAVTAIQAQTTE